MADAGTAVETDVPRAIQVDPHALGASALENAFADPFAQVVTVAQVDGRRLCRLLFQHLTVVVDGAAGRQGRDKVEDLLAPAFAQAQAFEQRLDVVGGQGLVVEHMVDLRRVVQQGTILAVEVVVIAIAQAQLRQAQVGVEYLHPTQVQ
ncbi:hypothetical protein D3C81_680130 [compost metagenome]